MLWVRFEIDGRIGIGTLSDSTIAVHEGNMFGETAASGESLALETVNLLTPCVPSKMICLWNNFHALAAKLDVAEPPEPLFFLKAPNAYLAHGGTIRRPKTYDGPVVYEGELGIVIGKECKEADEAGAADCIFGYTCVNDVTAAKIITKDSTFAQWARAKSFDTFGAFGPGIATDLDPMKASVKVALNDDERQNYPLSDMIFPPVKLVSLLSHDMTLMPGDIIACGTSVGVRSMKLPENSVSVTIEGIGTLANTYVN